MRDKERKNFLRRQAYAANPEKHRQKLREYQKKNPAKARQWGRTNYLRHRAARNAQVKQNYSAERQYHQRLAKQYGLNLLEYESLVARHGGVCAVCKRPEYSKSRSGKKLERLALDHDHVTGRPRGLLCGSCNKALGLLAEDLVRIRALAEYLEAYNASVQILQGQRYESNEVDEGTLWGIQGERGILRDGAKERYET